jgi:hypothetical protein
LEASIVYELGGQASHIAFGSPGVGDAPVTVGLLVPVGGDGTGAVPAVHVHDTAFAWLHVCEIARIEGKT